MAELGAEDEGLQGVAEDASLADALGEEGTDNVVSELVAGVSADLFGTAESHVVVEQFRNLDEALYVLDELGIRLKAQIERQDMVGCMELAQFALAVSRRLEAYCNQALEADSGFDGQLRAIVHDLRNALSSAEPNAEILIDILSEEGVDSAEVFEILEDIQLAVDSAFGKTKAFLKSLEREEALTPLADVLERFIGEATAGHDSLRVNIEDSGGISSGVTYRPSPMRLLLANFASNATKHGGATQLDIRIERGENDTVVMEVSDNGCGFPDDFDAEAAAYAEERGLNGNGLPDMWNLVEDLGGHIELIDHATAKFRITLPVNSVVSERAAAT